MNAALLLVTSACLVGQAELKKEGPPPPPASMVASACGSNCGSANDCGCEEFGHKLRHRMRGLFSRDCNDGCQATTCQSHNYFSSCNSGCNYKWNWQPAWRTHGHHDKCCAPANTCDTCERESFFSRLCAKFRRGSGCGDSCSSGCASGGCASGGCAGGACAPGPISAPVEKINLPDKMPKAPPKEQALRQPEVRIENQPTTIPPIATTPSVIPPVPAAPNVEAGPLPAPPPRVDADRKDPF